VKNQIPSEVQIAAVAELPERIYSLLAANKSVFVGTGPNGGVYRLGDKGSIGTFLALSEGMGDAVEHGTCFVSALASKDLDGDGKPELVALTSQESPQGKPRIYVWSLSSPPQLRAVAFADVKSSWSHGIAFGFDRTTGRSTVISSYCGYGEVMEFRLCESKRPSGFSHAGIEGRRIGQLPGSGETAASSRVFNQSGKQLLIASGFRESQAEIQIYKWLPAAAPSSTWSANGKLTSGPWKKEVVVTEDHRFANVRFLAGDVDGDGKNTLVAWWCSSLTGGDCAMIRYSLSPHGIESRDVLFEGPAGDYWPIDGQFALADTDGDGRPEVWFASGSGKLWRYEVEPNRDRSNIPAARPVLVCESEEGMGPVAAGGAAENGAQPIYFSVGRKLLRLTGSPRDPCGRVPMNQASRRPTG
jgi:hypothetical protein